MVTFGELSKADIYAMGHLHNLAVNTERALVAGSIDKQQQIEDALGSERPSINVLGPEAVAEITMALGGFVRRASADIEKNTAAKRQAEIDSTLVEESDHVDGVEWELEEIDDDA